MSTRKSKATADREKLVLSSPFTWPPESVLNSKGNHRWSRKVVFDLHEVIVEWGNQFAEFINRTHPGVNMQFDAQRFYNAAFDPDSNLTPELFDEAFATFARLSVGGYGDLKPIAGIVDTIKKIQAAGIKVEIWTWTPGAAELQPQHLNAYNTGIAQRVTRDLVRKLGLPIDAERDLRFMSPSSKIREMVEDHVPLIVEDNPATAVQVFNYGHAAILVPTTYNDITCRNVLRLSDRSELADAVIDFFKKLDEAGVLL